MSRAYTQAEIQTMFLENAKEIVRFWSKVEGKSTKEKISGAIFGVFTVLDGESAEMPGFSVIPHPHKDDKAWYQGMGVNWYPDDVDIAGDLHEQWAK